MIQPDPDLGWFWWQSAKELGHSSTFEGMALMLALGGPLGSSHEPEPPSDLQMVAARKWTRIRRALATLPADAQAVLESAYGTERPDPAVVAVLGPLAGAMVSACPEARKLLRSGQVDAVRLEAESKLAAAHDDFRIAFRAVLAESRRVQ